MPSSGIAPGGQAALGALLLRIDDLEARADATDLLVADAAGSAASIAARFAANEAVIAQLQAQSDPFLFDGPNPPIKAIGLWLPNGSGTKTLVPFTTIFNDAAINHTLLDAFIANTATYTPLVITSGTNRSVAAQSQTGYSDTLTVVGGSPVGTKTWQFISGSLPSGLTFNSNGTVTGNVAGGATLGTYLFTVQATDPLGATIQKSFSILCVGSGFSFNIPDPVPIHATTGVAFTYATDRFCANPAGARTYALTSPPAGWTIDTSTGLISCASPGASGVVTLNGTVTDGTTPLTWTTHILVDAVITGPTITTTSPLPVATKNSYYVAFLTHDGQGTPGYTWTHPGGAALPAGINFTGTQTLLTNIAGTNGSATLTLAAHGLQVGQPVLTGPNTLGFANPGVYFVKTVPSANTFTLTDNMANAAIAATGNDTTAQIATIPSIWGTPTVVVDPGLATTYRVTDSTPGGAGGPLYNEASLVLQVKDVTAPFAFGAFTVPHPVVGTIMPVFRIDQYVSGATGAVTIFDWDHGSDITTGQLNNTGDTLTWTGGLSTIANGTVISLTGITGTPGVVNGPAQHYVVMSAGTRTCQLAQIATPTTAIPITADTASVTIHFPTLPNDKVRLDYDGTVTGHQGALYMAAGDPATTAKAFTIKVSAFDAGSNAWLTQNATITVDPGGATLDLNGYSGITFGDTSGSPGDAVALANRAAWNNAQAAANTAGARLMCSGFTTGAPAILRVSIDKTGAGGGNILASGATSYGGAAGHDDFDLPNVIIRQHDFQPMPAESANAGNTMLWIGNVVAGFKHLNLVIDYNAANQYDTDVKRAGGAANRWGLYGHQLQIFNCGPIPAGASLVFYNSSGRTGSSGQTVMSSTTTTAAGSGSTNLPVTNRSNLPNGTFTVTITDPAGAGGASRTATVNGGTGTGAGTLTLSAAKTWANGATVSYSQYAEEVFNCQYRRDYGGSGVLGTGPAGVTGFDIFMHEDDAHSSSRRASGFKAHYTHDTDAAPSPMSYIRYVEGHHGRHAVGGYCSGSWTVLGWLGDDYEHFGNVEDGNNNNIGASNGGPASGRPTRKWVWGKAGVSGVQGTTQNCTRGNTSCGIQHNGNGPGGSSTATAAGAATKNLPVADRAGFVVGDTVQIVDPSNAKRTAVIAGGTGTGAGTLTLAANTTWANGASVVTVWCEVEVHGHHSIGDDSAIRADGAAPVTLVIDNQQVDAPNSACLTVTGSTSDKDASIAVLVTTNCFVHSLGTAHKCVGATLQAGQDWTAN